MRELLSLLNRDSNISAVSSLSAKKKADGPEEEMKSMPMLSSNLSSDILADQIELDSKRNEAIKYLKKMIQKI